jgi:hypothetical protein
MPSQTTVPPLRVAAKAAGTSAPTGVKISASVELFGRNLVGSAGPRRAEAAGERLHRRIAWPRERIDLALLSRDGTNDLVPGSAAVSGSATRHRRDADRCDRPRTPVSRSALAPAVAPEARPG